MCVMAGIHVNEASSIQAALELRHKMDPMHVSGSISIIPVVNAAGVYDYAVEMAEDGKNLHWQFPGSEDGSFSERLAHALQTEWASDADVLLDLHGGDIGEDLCDYAVFQQTEDEAWNRWCRRLASCFEAEQVVGLSPTGPDAVGRCCTGMARSGRVALVCESGIGGRLDGRSVNWHINGILNVARTIGLLDDGIDALHRHQEVLDRFQFVLAPSDGIYSIAVKAGRMVECGSEFAELQDQFGRRAATVPAPFAGKVMMRTTRQFVRKGGWLGAIAYRSR